MQFEHSSRVAAVLALAGLFGPGAARAEAVTVDFDTFATGAVSTDYTNRPPGDYSRFTTPPNAATSGEIRAGVGLGGSSALVVQNNGSGNDGVIDNIKSGRLVNAAGETSSGAANRYFQSSFWFRTASDQATDYAFKTESWGTDRTTWLGFFNDASGHLYAESSGYDAAGNGTSHILTDALTWGAWYRVVTQVDFVDGGAANDVVRQYLFDSTGALVGSAVDNTWEEGQRQSQYNYNNGQQVAVDAIGFQARYSTPGDTAYVDDVSWASSSTAFADPTATVPEPGAMALVLTAGLAAVGATRMRRG